MRKVYVVALAVVLLGIVPIFAASDAVTRLQAVPRPFPATRTDVGIIVNSVTVGVPDSGVLPCWNTTVPGCLPNSTVLALGIPAPMSVVPVGSSVEITLTADDVSYSGLATFAYAIRATATSTPIQTSNFSGDVYPSLWWAYFLNTAPTTPGRYLLQGTIIQGDSTSVVNTSLIVE